MSRSDSRQRRLEKNRLSARESRKRKKNYIEMLEKQKDILAEQNKRLICDNQSLRERQKVSVLAQTNILNFLDDRNELIDRLQTSMEEGASPDEIKAIIDCMKINSGTNGIERMGIIEYFFKGIVDLSFPHFVKNLFYGATHNLGLYDDSQLASAD